MECAYWQAGVCRSCTWIDRPYPDQVAAKQRDAADLLTDALGAAALGDLVWEAPVTSPTEGFRTKAKMVVGGTVDAPTFGILGPDRRGVDLRDCPITDPSIRRALPVLVTLVSRLRLEPYDVIARRGELKYVLVTSSLTGDLMVRFVLRSRRHLAQLRAALPLLAELVPRARVVTANIHPTHEAIVEGPEEVVLTPESTLSMPVGDVVLHLGPRSFSQTNTTVAAGLYRQVAAWATGGLRPLDEGVTVTTAPGTPDPHGLGPHPHDPDPHRARPHGATPRSLWDLYCGIGGFALHAAVAGIPSVTGVEVSADAVAAASRSAADLGLDPAGVGFVAADATAWALARPPAQHPDVVVVNPPRRGIGEDLARWLDGSGVPRVVYSSCHPASLASDLARMPHLVPLRARLFDMFPHTAHAEVAVLLERDPGRSGAPTRPQTPRPTRP